MQLSGEWFAVQVSKYMREIDRNHKGLVLFVLTTDWVSMTNHNYIFMIRRRVNSDGKSTTMVFIASLKLKVRVY